MINDVSRVPPSMSLFFRSGLLEEDDLLPADAASNWGTDLDWVSYQTCN